MKAFHNLEIQHVFCEANSCANWLARHSLHQSFAFHVFHSFPFDLLQYMYLDSIGSSSLIVNPTIDFNDNLHPLSLSRATLAGSSNGSALERGFNLVDSAL